MTKKSITNIAKVGRSSANSHSKIVVMLTCQYSEILGGAEKQCAALTQNLIEAGVNVVVVTSRVPGFKPRKEEKGVVRFWTYRPPQLAGRYLPASLLWALQVLIWIAWNHRRVSVLHCHQLRINAYVAALAYQIFGIPTVMKLGVGGERNDFNIISQKKYIVGRSGAKFVARRSSAVVAISSEIEKNCLEWGVPSERVLRIPNGVDVDQVEEIAVGRGNPRTEGFNNMVILAYVGRLSDEKNVSQIVDAVSTLACKGSYRLELLGDGPLLNSIAKSSASKRGQKIDCKGRVNNVFDHLQRMHFLLLVSSSEGLSNALLEAACAGVVPILSDVSGNRDVVDFCDYPLFVAGTSTEDIQVGLRAALSMSSYEWERWSTKIADSARKRYDSKAVRDRYLVLYENLSGESYSKPAFYT
ncbi:glycosyltransferase family 4 protein [Ruegeria arenilitoris]|uniref:glycosyltransferase family 4 protein n=1 Tax=Ruegeria arenilitoris TaxID=1173585 RepID=UPI00147C424A|nr:glycosyltransferase family 4 protein [Ruegeria arenilitoris]